MSDPLAELLTLCDGATPVDYFRMTKGQIAFRVAANPSVVAALVRAVQVLEAADRCMFCRNRGQVGRRHEVCPICDGTRHGPEARAALSALDEALR